MRKLIIGACLLIASFTATADENDFQTCMDPFFQDKNLSRYENKFSFDAPENQTFAILSNTSYPTKEEKKFLSALAKHFDHCFNKMDLRGEFGASFPAMVENQYQHHQKLMTAYAKLVTSKFTYGEFAQERAALHAEKQRQFQEIVARLEAEEREQQRMKEEQERRRKHEQAMLESQERMRQAQLQQQMYQLEMERMEHFNEIIQRNRPAPAINCTSRRIGYSIDTTCR